MQHASLDERSFRRRLLWSVLLPLLLMAVLAGVSLWQVNTLLTAAGWVEHTTAVIAALNRTERLLIDGQTGMRGYLLTGDRRFLEPYERSGPLLAEQLDELAALVSDNPQQSAQVRRLRTEGRGRVRLWVADNGIGIDPDRQGRIWGVFEQLHGIETYPGTGIGLAIVRRGVERMGGSAGVESQKGKGSRFFIDLEEG